MQAYSDDADGLRLLLRGMLEAAKTDDTVQLKALIKETEIPNSEVWFTATFGKEKGESWADPYGKMLEENESHFQEYLIQLAHLPGQVSVQKVDSAKMFGTLAAPLDVFLADWNPSGTNKNQKPDHIGYFFFIDGKFRWDSTITFIRDMHSFAEPEPPEVTSKDGAGTSRNDAGSELPAAKPGVDGVGYPSCVYCPPPEFPREGRGSKDKVTVLMKGVIRADGHAANIEIVKSGGAIFDEKAMEAVRRWRFKPAMGPNGIPVPVTMPIEVTFYLVN